MGRAKNARTLPIYGSTMASRIFPGRVLCAAWAASLLLAGCAGPPSRTTRPAEQAPGASSTHEAAIPAYRARPGRTRAVIAVVGENSGVEVSDFLVPFAILSRAGTLDVSAVTLEAGPLSTFTDLGSPGFRFETDTTVTQFDAVHPEGADYIIVPAQASTPRLIAWLKQQSRQGATIVTICNGALVAAKMGTFDGRRATAHWSTGAARKKQYPAIRWTPNQRYVADGNWVSTAGVSAAIPASIALVEAISGREMAQHIARAVGATAWSAQHDSDAFSPRLGTTALPLAKVLYTNRWLHGRDPIDVMGATGMDEGTLALTIDAYSTTGRSQAYLVSATGEPFVTRHGLRILPDRRRTPDSAVPLLTAADLTPVMALDAALAGIMQRYGRATAKGVALAFEYPDFPR